MDVTVVVTPRDHFSHTRRTIEDLYANTPGPLDLVVVDCGSPPALAGWLREQATARGFTLIRRDRYLPPNEARNLGVREARGDVIVFVENDVTVHPGWLEPLVRCAQETGAAVVSPLTFEGEPPSELIHFAGGEVTISDEAGTRHIRDRMWHASRRVDAVGPLERRQCSLNEFHTFLVRRDVLERIGSFDEAMLSTREHVDFALQVAQAGGEVWFEPESVVSFVPPGPPFALRDLPFYMLRWSDAWERRSLDHFRAKYDLADDEFFQLRRARPGWRRHHALLRPMIERVLPRGATRVTNAVRRPERRLNRVISDRYDRQRARNAA